MQSIIYTFFLLHGLLFLVSYTDMLAAAQAVSQPQPQPEPDLFGRLFCFVEPNAMLTKYECWYINIKLSNINIATFCYIMLINYKE